MEQVTYFGLALNSFMPSTLQILAFLVFSSSPELLTIHDYKYENITITPVTENGPVFTMSTNYLGGGTLEDTTGAPGGVPAKGSKEQSSSNSSSGGFPSSPVQHARAFTAASFLLNH